jgi:Right handed beta helix region
VPKPSPDICRAWLFVFSFVVIGCGNDVVSHGGSEATGYPKGPPAEICNQAGWLKGPTQAPEGSVVVPSGDNSNIDFSKAGVTYWFASGTHTLGLEPSNTILPGNNSSFLGAPGAILDGQGANEFAFCGHATKVTIAHLEMTGFVSPNDQGVVNHDGGTGWFVESVYLHHNGGAAIFVSSGNILRDSCITDNGQYGFQGIGPGGGGSARDIVVEHNEIARNGDGGKLWDVEGGTFTNNYCHDNGVGLWIDGNSRNVTLEHSLFADNENEAVVISSSYNTQILNNAFISNAIIKGNAFVEQANPFPVSAIYVANSGGDSRIKGTPTIEITSNHFVDNWGGVTVWEEANRFCGSPASGDERRCTLVSSGATTTTCVAKELASDPLYEDCRWKTKNVTVKGNDFWNSLADARCVANRCALQALIASEGTAPDWSPYLGTALEDDVTFEQNNRFLSNHYRGAWQFMAHDTDTTLAFDAWTAPPYRQDSSSVME